MAFDWIQFFNQYGVEFITEGPNVARDDVNIKCPFCGASDPSFHMGVSTVGRGWSCWRNRQEHHGKDAVRLVKAVLRCSTSKARSIVGADAPALDDSFMGRVSSSLNPPEQTSSGGSLSLLDEFKEFTTKPSASLFIRHLEQRRGFTLKQILRFTDDYDLHYCTTGSFKGRVIFPIYFDRKLVNWTGRSVYPSVKLRYKTLPTDHGAAVEGGVPQAVKSIGQCLLWFDDLMASDFDTIILVEGPFDALKLNVIGEQHGVCSTCFFTSVPSDNQIDLFHELLPRFKRKFLLPDVGAEVVGMKTLSRLSELGVKIKKLPDGFDDPGEIDEKSLLNKVLCG